jgi:hypothetical protein
MDARTPVRRKSGRDWTSCSGAVRRFQPGSSTDTSVKAVALLSLELAMPWDDVDELVLLPVESVFCRELREAEVASIVICIGGRQVAHDFCGWATDDRATLSP